MGSSPPSGSYAKEKVKEIALKKRPLRERKLSCEGFLNVGKNRRV